MRAWAISLSAVVFLAYSPPIRAQAPLTVYDRQGNAITVYNRFDGENYSIRITQHDRAGRLVRDHVHSNGYQEQAVALDEDGEGGVYIAGVRYWQGTKYLWLMKYYSAENWSWDWSDDHPGCSASEITANHEGDSWVAGACRTDEAYFLRLVRLHQRGPAAWSQNYPTGSRCHVRNLSVDDGDRAAVTVLLGGAQRDSNALIQTVVYDGHGRQLTSY